MNNPIETYKIFSAFYDKYVGEFDIDIPFYKSFCSTNKKILEIGCGTGRILDTLLQTNCKLTGVDISDEMLHIARNKFEKRITNGDLILINHNFEKNRLNICYDIVLLTFYTFNYIIDNASVFLKNIYSSMNNGALLLIDLFYPNSLLDTTIDGKWTHKTYKTDDGVINIQDCRRMQNNIENRQQIFNIKGTKTKIESTRRYYSPLEIKKILSSVGYNNIKFAYGYEYNSFQDTIRESNLRDNYIVKATKRITTSV